MIGTHKLKNIPYTIINGKIKSVKGKKPSTVVTDGVVTYRVGTETVELLNPKRFILGTPSLVGMLYTKEYENGFIFGNCNHDIDNVDYSGIVKVPLDKLKKFTLYSGRECYRYGDMVWTMKYKQLETRIDNGYLYVVIGKRTTNIPFSDDVVIPYVKGGEYHEHASVFKDKEPVRGHKPYIVSSTGYLYKIEYGNEVKVEPLTDVLGNKYIIYLKRRIPLEKMVLLAWDKEYHMEEVIFIDKDRKDKYNVENLSYKTTVKYGSHSGNYSSAMIGTKL